MNPYKLLGVKTTDDMVTIKNRFKKIVLKVHPDKGGSRYMFELVKKAYVEILNHKNNTKERDLVSYTNERKETNYNVKQIFDKQNFNSDQFNKLFQDTRMESVNDHGYGEYLSQGNRKSESDSLSRTANITKFNKSALVHYKEPEVLSLASNNYEELGGRVPDDYSSDVKSNVVYTDYKKAYTEGYTVDELSRYSRNKTYSSVDKLVAERKVIKELSENERMYFEQKAQETEKQEQERIGRYLNHLSEVQKHNHYLSNRIEFR